MGYTNCTIFNLSGSVPYNHHRTQSAQKYGGQYNINETWTIFRSGSSGIPGNALEDFTIDIKQSSDTNILTVGIQGTIQGLETVSYTGIDVLTYNVTVDKYTSALSFWSGVQGRLLPRCQKALTNGISPLPTLSGLNPTKINKSLGQNVTNGVITYSYEYTNKPSTCVSGALNEDIQFAYEFPTDVFASIVVLGRASGPIIQLMGTRTAYTLTANIDVNMPIVTGCAWSLWDLNSVGCPHSSVKTLLSNVESGLSASYSTLVKTKDTPSWNPTQGKYNRSVTWLYNACTGSGTAVGDL